ncbi:Assembly factor CBP4 [Wickerhamiella sorbophila]|uniref:Cytochrome b mRNA-processing protein 4 n=1 Tax=Wickerhamiella sorbophila TaxID=45607 RepID=A0A2T0FH58_9ASCO|nr:Assembly factor CBP4 [Wickerhamiella sorbophila]PRT54325.1 Assembly factor CBP4 [Wickerhamiella sorbophila]
MPPTRQWAKFFLYSGLCIGSGIIFVNYFVPSDEKFLSELSPELKAKYHAEKEIRARANQLMQQKMKDTQDKPAWLQGLKSSQKLERQILEEARKEVEQRTVAGELASERERLRELAEKEKKL